MKRAVVITGLCLLFNLVGCSSPAARLKSQAKSFGFESIELSASGFVLSSFYHPPEQNYTKRLHVYLEGDGNPWEQGVIPTVDPTTRTSLMLQLMSMDKAPALYLGRPCYNGHANDSGCHAGLWTGARYSKLVLETMAVALQDFSQRYAYTELMLIGHSGGGSLAILMVDRVLQARAVVTLAVNYDIDAWADYHGYNRLTESINPAATANIGIPEWHFLAEQDRNIPPVLNFQALSRRDNSSVEIVPAIEHNKGWQQVWAEILLRLAESH